MDSSPCMTMYRTSNDPILIFVHCASTNANSAFLNHVAGLTEDIVGKNLAEIVSLDDEQVTSLLRAIETNGYYEFSSNIELVVYNDQLKPHHAISGDNSNEFYIIFTRIPSMSSLDSRISRLEVEKSALISAVHSLLDMTKDVKETSRAIFNLAKQVTGATMGYIALLNTVSMENDILFLDPGDHECTVDPSLAMPVRGFRGTAYNTGQTVHHNCFWDSDYATLLPGGHVEVKNVLFSPLIIEGKVVGLMGLGNKPSGFTDHDVAISKVLSHAVAVALQNHRLVHELDKSRQRAEEAASAKTSYLSHMAHEIRSPLYPILALTQLLVDSTCEGSNGISTEELKSNLCMIHDSSQHLLSIINDILDFNKIGAGKLELDNRSFSVYSLLKTAVSIVTPLATTSEVKLETRIDDLKDVIFVGDEGRFRQVVINLLSNAIKFSKSDQHDGVVTITCKMEDSNSVLTSVSDNGIGISDEASKRVFVPLEQASAEIGTEFGGTGLGMAISQQIVELMGGTIWFDSVEGVGSTFNFRLPLPQKVFESPNITLETVPRTPVVETIGLPVDLLHVLIVDDAVINLKVTSSILSKFGILKRNIGVANSGEEAIRLLKDPNIKYNVVLLDVQMPEMDGIQVLEYMNEFYTKSPDCARPAIAMLTAMAEQSIYSRATELGACAFFSKPLRIDQLSDFIRDVAQKVLEEVDLYQ